MESGVAPIAAPSNPPPIPHPAGAVPVVELHDVVAVLGSFPALAGFTMRVERGEIVLLRGPNGAGKTTLLRLCAGLLPVARGSGTVAGCDLVTQRDEVRARVGLLGHTNGLYADLTVRENVEFWGATVGASTDEIASSLERMGLAARLADVPVGRLSAGQKRRTALACLVARRAQLWLLDEPHAGLDAATTLWRDGQLVFALCDRCAASHDVLMRPTAEGVEVRARARTPILVGGAR